MTNKIHSHQTIIEEFEPQLDECEEQFSDKRDYHEKLQAEIKLKETELELLMAEIDEIDKQIDTVGVVIEVKNTIKESFIAREEYDDSTSENAIKLPGENDS